MKTAGSGRSNHQNRTAFRTGFEERPQIMDEYVNSVELGRRLGVSEAAVRKHVSRGLYSPEARGSMKGKYHVGRCKAAYETGRDPDAALRGVAGAEALGASGPSTRLPENSLTKARAAQAVLKAQREQIALARAKGELISAADAMKAARAVISIVIDRIEGAAAQIGPRVVGLDAAAAERVARDILHGVRAEIAGIASAIEVLSDAK